MLLSVRIDKNLSMPYLALQNAVALGASKQIFDHWYPRLWNFCQDIRPVVVHVRQKFRTLSSVSHRLVRLLRLAWSFFLPCKISHSLFIFRYERWNLNIIQRLTVSILLRCMLETNNIKTLRLYKIVLDISEILVVVARKILMNEAWDFQHQSTPRCNMPNRKLALCVYMRN